MILKLTLLKEGVAEHVETTYDPKALDLEFVDFHYTENINLEGSVEKNRETVTFYGTMKSQIEQTCARCLETIQNELLAPFDLSYNIEGRETIDATSDLRDILILLHPDRFLCQAECRGICPGCGTYLNRESCRCTKKTSLESSGLGQIKIIEKEGKL